MYKLKHLPTGLYYQPHKHMGSNLSKRGKVYQTSAHGLSSAMRSAKFLNEDKQLFPVYVQQDSVIHKLAKDKLIFTECRHTSGQMVAWTKLNDWEKEYIQIPKLHTYE